MFAVALEPSLDGLRDTARALTRRPLPNIALVVTSVEAAAFDGIADEATIHFPWGALLDSVLGSRADVLAAVARTLRPGARLRILLSTIERDGREPLNVTNLDGLRAAYAAAGLALQDVRVAIRSDIEDAHSSWGKRLDAGSSRPAFVLRCVRRGDGAASLLPAGGPDERARAEDR